MDTCSMFINKDSLLLHCIHPKFIIQSINIKLLTMTHRPLLPSSWLHVQVTYSYWTGDSDLASAAKMW